jgi:hypothetical protein
MKQMKTFCKLLAISIIALILLGSGLYLVLNNLGVILTEDHSGLKCRVVSSGVEIKTGHWAEKIQFKLPAQIKHTRGKWEFQSGNRIITIYTMPTLRIKL